MAESGDKQADHAASVIAGVAVDTLPVSYQQPDHVRRAIAEAVDGGFRHVILILPAPYPDSVARWVVDELIAASG